MRLGCGGAAVPAGMMVAVEAGMTGMTMGFRSASWWWAAFVVLGACGGDDEPQGLCDAAELQTALAAAEPGATVTVGECRVSGYFAVPAGVTLTGLGLGKSVIVGLEADVAIDVAAGDPAAIVRDLSVESDTMGVRIRGAGAATIERVDVEAARGVALAADGAQSVQLTGITLRGPMTASAAEAVNAVPEPSETATMGLIVLEVADARLSDVEITGFAGWGVFAGDSETVWDGGRVATNLRYGVHVQGGHATLRNVEVVETLQGGLLLPSMAVLGTLGAALDSSALEIHDNQNFGLLSFGSSGRHENLVVQAGGDAGVWLQGATGVTLEGAQIFDNYLAGVAVVDSSEIALRNVAVERTALLTTIAGDQGNELVGDGLQLIRSTEGIRLASSSFTANERIGLLIDLGAVDASDVGIDDVDVSVTGDALGVVVQNGTIENGWDSSIHRNEDAERNDGAFDGTPQGLPPPREEVGPIEVDGVMGPNH